MGFVTGNGVGITVGLAVGFATGVGVGAEGLAVGFASGESVGAAIGLAVGFATGESVGAAVGMVVGFAMTRLRILAAAASYQRSLAYSCTEGQVSCDGVAIGSVMVAMVTAPVTDNVMMRLTVSTAMRSEDHPFRGSVWALLTMLSAADAM